MQRLDIEIIRIAMKEKIQKLEIEMRDVILTEEAGYLFLCPYCQYTSRKNRKGSAKLFDDKGELIFKCFNCGKWRRV